MGNDVVGEQGVPLRTGGEEGGEMRVSVRAQSRGQQVRQLDPSVVLAALCPPQDSVDALQGRVDGGHGRGCTADSCVGGSPIIQGWPRHRDGLHPGDALRQVVVLEDQVRATNAWQLNPEGRWGGNTPPQPQHRTMPG